MTNEMLSKSIATTRWMLIIPCFANTLAFVMFIRHYIFSCSNQKQSIFRENVKQKEEGKNDNQTETRMYDTG